MNILLFIQCGALLVVVSVNIQVLLIKIRDFFNIWGIHIFQSFQRFQDIEFVHRPFPKSLSQFPGSLLWTPGTFGAKTIHLATKYDEERLAVFSLELSYGSSSNYLIFYAYTGDRELLPIPFWNTRGIEAVVSGQLKSSAKMQSESSSLSWTFLRSKFISLFSYILIAYQLSFSFVKATIECNRERCGTESSN